MLDHRTFCRSTVPPVPATGTEPQQRPRDMVPLAGTFLRRLDRRLGYLGNARYVAISYLSSANALLTDDGRRRHLIVDPTALQAFRDHIGPAALAHGVRLNEGGDVLLVDRITGLSYFASPDQAADLLATRKPESIYAELVA